MVEDKALAVDETDRGCGGFGSTGLSDVLDGVQTMPLNLIIDKNAVCDCHSTT